MLFNRITELHRKKLWSVSYHIMDNTKKTGVGEIFTTLDDTLQSEERQIVHFWSPNTLMTKRHENSVLLWLYEHRIAGCCWHVAPHIYGPKSPNQKLTHKLHMLFHLLKPVVVSGGFCSLETQTLSRCFFDFKNRASEGFCRTEHTWFFYWIEFLKNW